MLFSISPYSGFDNSYFDIRFSIVLDKTYPDGKYKVYFVNKEIGSKIDVLAVSNGHIDEDGYIVGNSKHQIDGYFNLFNDDKMNTKLEPFPKIDIECNVVFEDKTYSKTVSFFNESFSVNNEILPFDFILENKKIDLASGKPFEFGISADSEKIVHLRIESLDSLNRYDFFVYTKKGLLKSCVPLEVLNYELNLYKTASKQFHVCYMKPHGVTYSNIVNEKKIIIKNSELSFENRLKLFPQTRFDPIGRELNYDDFVISDRYFVPTFKEYSFFSKLKTDENKSRLSKLFSDELVELRQPKHEQNPNIWKKEEDRPIKQFSVPDISFYSTVNSIYNQKTSSFSSLEQKQKSESIISISGSKTGCAECSRKKKSGV